MTAKASARAKRPKNAPSSAAPAREDSASPKTRGHKTTRTSEPAVEKASKPRKPSSSKTEAGKKGVGTDRPAKRPRREQQRAKITKLAILKAALSEFAEKGFDAASTRDIGERAGMQHPLITYHYRTKDILWRAVAEHFISEIREAWDARIPNESDLTPLERIREEFRALFEVQTKYPDFHHFMLRESRPGNPRLPWLAQTILAPMVNRVLPQISLAQKQGQLPAGQPILVHYLMIGMTSVLSSLGAEIQALTGKSVNTPEIADDYFNMIERVMFRGAFDKS